MKKNFKKVIAFTLAEVLITLGIIGIVSAITIPTLTKNYQVHAWNTASNVFQKKLESALKTMNTQQVLAGHGTTEAFVNELSKNFKINKICDNTKITECFAKNITMRNNPITVDIGNIRTSADFGQSDWNTNLVGVQFANAVTAIIAYNPECKQDPYSNLVTGSDCLAILYDISGAHPPNYLSKDLRNNGYVKKIGNKSICAFEINNTCYTTAPFSNEAHIWKACSSNGTSKNPDDVAFMKKYGLKYCLRSSDGKEDYWAGAVKACDGVDKLPTSKQLAEIANQIYGTTAISNESYYEGKRNNLSATTLGFQYADGAHFYIWSKQEDTSNLSYARFFYPTYTKWGQLYRYNSYRFTVCVGE